MNIYCYQAFEHGPSKSYFSQSAFVKFELTKVYPIRLHTLPMHLICVYKLLQWFKFSLIFQ